MVTYTMPQQRKKKERSERLRRDRDQIKFIDFGFERWQVVRFRKARTQGLSYKYHNTYIPLVRKATGSHLIKSIHLEKTQSHVSGFCYAQNRACYAVYL